MSALNLRALFGVGTIATVTNFNVGTTSTILLANNPNRKGFIIYNTTGTLFIKLDSTTTNSEYTQKLSANTSWEVSNYIGTVSAIKATGTTPVLVTSIE
jgi:hypothetical protein